MDERSVHRIQEHLQQEDVQRRIQRYMEKGHAEATVTISRAAELFNLSENRLRDWEEYGLLSPLRPTGPKGRRLYTPAELDKLAIIRELIDAGYAPSDIPPTIKLLWNAVSPHPIHAYYPSPISPGDVHPQGDLPINRRIEQAREEAFWRFYAPRQPARAHRGQARRAVRDRLRRQRRREGARRRDPHRRTRRRHRCVTARLDQARRTSVGARPGRDASRARHQRAARARQAARRRRFQDRTRRRARDDARC